jgi:vacuolar-type H+-ATPase subunit F/Vma7
MKRDTLVVIGDEDAVFGLGLLGLRGEVVTDEQGARQALTKALRDPATAVVLITENWAAVGRDIEQETSRSDFGPLVVEIPSAQREKHEDRLQEQMRRVLGTSLEF